MAATKTKGEPAAPPEPKTLTRTPSGVEIAYFDEPRRYYQVRNDEAAGRGEGFAAVGEWVEVPSVTTILGCLDKPALPWWGMKTGTIGVLELWERGILARADDGKIAANVNGTWVYATPENVVDLLTVNRLTVNHVRDKAGNRGQATHDAFEAWAATGAIPNPEADGYEEDERPYLEALRKFCVDMDGAWETGGVEVAVGSVEHRFAGRYDLRGKTTKTVRLTARALTADGKGPLKSGPKTVDVPACRLLIDLKTSKGIYGTHLMQLEAYEGAGIECGYEPTDARAVLHVTQHGLYEFKRARATYDDFLAIRRTYDALESVKEALKS